MKISPNRILYLDEVRSLAIILVVVGHVTRLYSYDFISWLFCSSVFAFTRIGVPLFFTVSGALLLRRKYDIEKFLLKRFKRVMLPFASWIIIYLILGVVLWHFTPSLNYVFDVAFGISDYSSIFWFIWSLIGVYLLIPVVSSFIREEKDKGYKYLILITVILSVLFTLGFFANKKIIFNFKLIFYFFSVFGYFIIGSYVHNTEFKYSNGKMFGLGLLLFIVGYLGHFYQIFSKGYGGVYLTPVDFFNIFVILETIGIFLLFKFANLNKLKLDVNSLKTGLIGKIIVTFSSCSFGIYFSHYILLRYLFYNGIFAPYRRVDAFFWLPVSSIVLVLLSWALIFIMSKIPFVKIASGVK